MVYDFYPTLKPFFSDLNETSLKYYLVTTEFNRFLIKNGYENLWEQMHKKRKSLTYVVSLGPWDDKPFEYQDSFYLLIDVLFRDNQNQKDFEFLLTNTLINFINWTDKEIKNFAEILEDIKLLEIENKEIEKLNMIYSMNNLRWMALKTLDNSKIKKDKESQSTKLTLNDKKKSWKRAIAKAEIEIVVNEIIELGVEDENDFIALSGRWNSLQNKYHKGVMKEDDVTIEHNKIIQALLSLIKKLPNTEGYINN